MFFMTSRALVMGRFQPFHLGHLELVKKAAAEYDEVVVAISSANESFTIKNPFTAGERIELVTAALREAGLSKFFVVPVGDTSDNATWVAHTVALCPKFDVVLTNNTFVALLFETAKYKVVRTEAFGQKEWRATEVRKRMATGEHWEALVPLSVVTSIIAMNGTDRLRQLFSE